MQNTMMIMAMGWPLGKIKHEEKIKKGKEKKRTLLGYKFQKYSWGAGGSLYTLGEKIYLKGWGGGRGGRNAQL